MTDPTDKKLESKLEQYREIAKQTGGKVDVTALMLDALEKSQTNLTSSRQKHWAYLVSLGLPPLGLIFSLAFWFNGKDDGKRQAIICAVLTAISIALVWLTIQYMFSSAGVNYNQLQQAPAQMQQLLQ